MGSSEMSIIVMNFPQQNLKHRITVIAEALKTQSS